MRWLDHVAIAVPDISEAVRRFVDDFGLTCTGQEDVPSALTRTAFFPVSDPAHPAMIELITPLNGEGPVARALEKRGPGLHHLCFRTDDLAGDVERLRARGYQFTTAAPTPGAHGSTVIFVHPRSTGGVLIELSQGADHG